MSNRIFAQRRGPRLLPALVGLAHVLVGIVVGVGPAAAASPPPPKATVYDYDSAPLVKGVNRGGERIVTGGDGTGYYTNDHYQTFTQFTGPGG